MKSKTVREWKLAYTKKEFDINNFDFRNAGWDFYRCKETTLYRRTQSIASIISRIIGGKINIDNAYIILRNICNSGRLFDEITFMGNQIIVDNHIVYCDLQIRIKPPSSNLKFVVINPSTLEILWETNYLSELIVWLNTPWTWNKLKEVIPDDSKN